MTASLIARHEVNDFATWKKEYDGHAEFIKGMGVIAESVHRDLDNPNMVTVYHQFANVATLEAFKVAMSGDDFKAMAKRHGIRLETMKIFLMQDVLPLAGIRTVSATVSGTASGIARYEVKDFAAWLKWFNGNAERKKELGVIAESVHRDLDNPNMLTVYYQFADVATIRAFAAAPNSDRFRAQAQAEGNILLETMVVMVMTDVE